MFVLSFALQHPPPSPPPCLHRCATAPENYGTPVVVGVTHPSQSQSMAPPVPTPGRACISATRWFPRTSLFSLFRYSKAHCDRIIYLNVHSRARSLSLPPWLDIANDFRVLFLVPLVVRSRRSPLRLPPPHAPPASRPQTTGLCTGPSFFHVPTAHSFSCASAPQPPPLFFLLLFVHHRLPASSYSHSYINLTALNHSTFPPLSLSPSPLHFSPSLHCIARNYIKINSMRVVTHALHCVVRKKCFHSFAAVALR